MLSRRHIRVKVLQVLYSRFSDDETPMELSSAKNLLHRNTVKLYELYLYLLLMLDELGHFVSHYEEEVKNRYVFNQEEIDNSIRLYSSSMMQRLIANEKFHVLLKQYKMHWMGDNDLLRKIFLDLKNQPVYEDFIKNSEINPYAEREVFSFIIKNYTTHLPLLVQHLEETYFNWWDDKKIVLQAAAKSILSLSDAGADFIQPFSKEGHEQTIEFGDDLLTECLKHNDELTALLNPRITKWDPKLVALIDTLIIKMALCEFLYFPSIPLTVTINEYVDLAKIYSTPNSKKFINGVLDGIKTDLKKDNTITKN